MRDDVSRSVGNGEKRVAQPPGISGDILFMKSAYIYVPYSTDRMVHLRVCLTLVWKPSYTDEEVKRAKSQLSRRATK